MAITTQDAHVNALANNQQRFLYKRRSIATANGALYSHWRLSAAPLDGAIPTTMAACDSTSTGALPFTNPTGGNKTYLYQYSITASAYKNIIVVDRLCASGGLDGTVTTAQSVGSVTLTRGVQTNLANVEWFLEVYAALGSTGVTATISYTNHLDVSGKTTTVSIPASVAIGRLLEIVPASGDLIKSVQSVTLSGTTGTPGNFGVTALIRYAGVSDINPGYFESADFTKTGMPQIPDSACLTTIEVGLNNTSTVSGNITLAQG